MAQLLHKWPIIPSLYAAISVPGNGQSDFAHRDNRISLLVNPLWIIHFEDMKTKLS